MFAIIETGGKQYKVNEGDIIYVEKLDVNEGETVTFDRVKALSTADNFVVGAPHVAGATVTANVLANGKAKKPALEKTAAKRMILRRFSSEKRKIPHTARIIPTCTTVAIRATKPMFFSICSNSSRAYRVALKA